MRSNFKQNSINVFLLLVPQWDFDGHWKDKLSSNIHLGLKEFDFSANSQQDISIKENMQRHDQFSLPKETIGKIYEINMVEYFLPLTYHKGEDHVRNIYRVNNFTYNCIEK